MSHNLSLTYGVSVAKRDNTGRLARHRVATTRRGNTMSFFIAFKSEPIRKQNKKKTAAENYTGRVFKSFRTDAYTTHHRFVNLSKRAQYCQLSYEEKVFWRRKDLWGENPPFLLAKDERIVVIDSEFTIGTIKKHFILDDCNGLRKPVVQLLEETVNDNYNLLIKMGSSLISVLELVGSGPKFFDGSRICTDGS